MSIKPLSESEARSQIHEIMQDQFDEVIEDYIGKDEKIFAVANTTTYESSVGFFMVTNKRILKVSFFDKNQWFEKRKRVLYFKEGKGFLSSQVPDTRYWVPEPTFPLTKGELKSRVVEDTVYSVITSIERKEFHFKHGDAVYHLLELDFRKPHPYRGTGSIMEHVTFEFSDGQKAYELISYAIQNGGKIASETKGNFIAELERIYNLYKEGFLTKEEAEIAKRKYLS